MHKDTSTTSRCSGRMDRSQDRDARRSIYDMTKDDQAAAEAWDSHRKSERTVVAKRVSVKNDRSKRVSPHISVCLIEKRRSQRPYNRHDEHGTCDTSAFRVEFLLLLP